MSSTKKKLKKMLREAGNPVAGKCQCGKPLKYGKKRCPACKRANPLRAVKSAGYGAVKTAGGNVVAITSKWRCANGHVNKSSHAHCVTGGCGLSQWQRRAPVRKAAGGPLTKLAQWDFIAREAGLRNAAHASVYDPDPGMRRLYNEALIDPDGAA